MYAKFTKLTNWKQLYKWYKCINVSFFSIAFIACCILINSKTPICSAAILINVSVMLPHFLHISRQYIDTITCKNDSLPYEIIEKSNCSSQRFLGFVSVSVFMPSVCQNQTVNHVTTCGQYRPAISRTHLYLSL
jgi:hypothetical protein